MTSATNESIGQVHPADVPRLIWGMEAIGREAGLSKRQVYYLIRTGRIKTIRVGRRHLTTPAQILADLLMVEK